jgi:phosphoribosylaminoimidazole-succinocarboxamide synthase
MGYDPHTFRRRAMEMNFHFKEIFGKMGIDIVDFKLEYGHDNTGGLYLADEISPDNMRLWKKDTRERFDKDLFRKGEGDIVEAYKYILMKLNEI